MKPCNRCPHDFGGHHMVATNNDDPMKGGIVTCQVKGCQCYATWSPSGVDAADVVIPSDEVIEEIRKALQHEEDGVG